MTHDQKDAAARLQRARYASHRAAIRAQRSNDRFAAAAEAAAKAEAERNQAHAHAHEAQRQHQAALAHAVELGYRHSHRIDATEDDDWIQPTAPAYEEHQAYATR